MNQRTLMWTLLYQTRQELILLLVFFFHNTDFLSQPALADTLRTLFRKPFLISVVDKHECFLSWTWEWQLLCSHNNTWVTAHEI